MMFYDGKDLAPTPLLRKGFHHHLYLEKDLGPAAPLILEKYFPHPLILEK